MLELRRGGKHDVRVIGGVGLKVLVHDAEEVVARKAGLHLRDSGATAIGLEL